MPSLLRSRPFHYLSLVLPLFPDSRFPRTLFLPFVLPKPCRVFILFSSPSLSFSLCRRCVPFFRSDDVPVFRLSARSLSEGNSGVHTHYTLTPRGLKMAGLICLYACSSKKIWRRVPSLRCRKRQRYRWKMRGRETDGRLSGARLSVVAVVRRNPVLIKARLGPVLLSLSPSLIRVVHSSSCSVSLALSFSRAAVPAASYPLRATPRPSSCSQRDREPHQGEN